MPRSEKADKGLSIISECESKLALDRDLVKELNGTGVVAQTFDRICEAGYPREQLQEDLLFTRHLHHKRSTRSYTGKDAKRLQTLADEIEDIARQLLEVQSAFPLLQPLYPRLTVDADMFSAVADSIRSASSHPKLRRFVGLTTTQWLPHLIDMVRERTGKPHFADMATLIGAALGKTVSEDELKMRCHRHTRERNGMTAKKKNRPLTIRTSKVTKLRRESSNK